MNSKPTANKKRGNPNVSGIGKEFRDTRTRSGAKINRDEPRYDEDPRQPMGRDPYGGVPDRRDRDDFGRPEPERDFLGRETGGRSQP